SGSLYPYIRAARICMVPPSGAMAIGSQSQQHRRSLFNARVPARRAPLPPMRHSDNPFRPHMFEFDLTAFCAGQPDTANERRKPGGGVIANKNASELQLCRCPRQDSNLRPSAPEADALSPELRGRMRETLRRWAPTA